MGILQNYQTQPAFFQRKPLFTTAWRTGIFSEKPISAHHFAIYWYYCACWIQILEKVGGEKHEKRIFTQAGYDRIGTGFMLGVQINDDCHFVCAYRIRNNDPDGDASYSPSASSTSGSIGKTEASGSIGGGSSAAETGCRAGAADRLKSFGYPEDLVYLATRKAEFERYQETMIQRFDNEGHTELEAPPFPNRKRSLLRPE
ncbi:hypothetical protein [Paenibacillus tyrfis]|uniref:hypothetical protein n=1 Tax=Paenibacillus tyrfis TaxID=1501230 RepID=UPI0024902449|nr:hypothetical protein [Paenibacillus tyrfis]